MGGEGVRGRVASEEGTGGAGGHGDARAPGEGRAAERYLLCPEEWDDPAGRDVICEYHSAGLEGTEGGAEVDIGLPAGLSGLGGIPRLRSEYHLEGAPYMEGGPAGGGAAPAQVDGGARVAGGGDVGASAASPGGREAPGSGRTGGRERRQDRGNARPSDGRPLDLATAEMALYAVSRALFGRGVRVPIRVRNGIDMDLIVRDKDVILDTNSVELVVPELTVWHITYAYKGRPVLELGRGVRDGLHLHRWNAFVLLLAVWWERRGRRRRMAKAARDAGREEATLASRA